MAETIDQAQHDFWRAPVQPSNVIVRPERISTCRCGTEFIVSSLYCHACGASRPEPRDTGTVAIPGVHELCSLAKLLELTMPSVVAFLLGILCLVAALTISVFLTVHTLLDWQAIQLWRIEWLLGAVAFFVAGCLLKKSS